MHELRGRLLMVERALDAGQYRAGEWTAVVRTLRAQPRAVRRALADDVSRVSRKVHRRHPVRTCSLGVAVGLELAATVAGGALLWLGLAIRSNAAALVALVIWITTFQPLLKLAVGLALGVRYDYAYLLGVEPRIKLRFGTYLAASRPARILLHLSGCIGSALAAWVVGRLARPTLPLTATVATALLEHRRIERRAASRWHRRGATHGEGADCDLEWRQGRDGVARGGVVTSIGVPGGRSGGGDPAE